MTTPEQNRWTDGSIATDDTFDEADRVSVEQDGPDLLFSPDDRIRFDQRWTDIQSRFVDDPWEAVESADELVAEVMGRIADRLAERRSILSEDLAGEGETETEDLRLATQRYRAFFQRLLST